MLYILGEPSIGLHQRDNERLIATLGRLRDLGNAVIVVEHDEGTMRAADHLVDLGPAAGEHGGWLVIKIEMHFLPDVYVPCEQCHGKRYNRETLEMRFKGRTIADVLDMTVEEAVDFFQHIPKIARRLRALHDVRLDYIRLGQPATTLSGGEAQRVKLASELCKVATGRTLYILDEPTMGLHFADVHRLWIDRRRKTFRGLGLRASSQLMSRPTRAGARVRNTATV